MKSLETISEEIAKLESERDFGDITPEGIEQLAVLNLCYDLLSRTQTAQAMQVPQPEEMKEPGFDDEFISVYGVSSNPLADFAFSLSAKIGTIDMKQLLKQAMVGHTQKQCASAVGIRANTISDYLNDRKCITVCNYEKILNYAAKK